MSGSTSVRALRVAQESSFGQISSTTNLPTTTGLTYVSVEGQRSDVTTIGEPVISEVEELRSGFYVRPPEMVTVLDGSGNKVQRRKGQVVLVCRVRNLGASPTTFATLDDHPIAWMLHSSMQEYPSSGTQVVDSGGTTTAFVSDSTPVALPGSVLAWDYLGKRHYTGVTNYDSGTDTYTLSPALPAAPANGQTLRGSTFYAWPNNSGVTPGPSLAFELQGDGWLTRAWGCRLASLNIAWEMDALATWTFTFEAAHVQDFHSEGTGLIPDPVRADGHVVNPLGSSHIISSTRSDGTGPLTLARTALPVESGSIDIAFTLQPCGTSETILGMSDMEVGDIDVTVNLALCQIQSLVANDYRDGVPRSLMLAFGPTGAGQGAYCYLPSAVMQSDPNLRDLGGAILRQNLSYKPGLYRGDEATGDALGENTVFRLGFPLSA